jgi:hypothetical protein
VEKVRLDARRIGLASTLSTEEKLGRLVAIVRHRMPSTLDVADRYARASGRQLARHGVTLLSTYVTERVGVCRERAFLLQALLAELGIRANVRYGVQYDSADAYVDAHAWVEASVEGRRLIIDPSRRDPIQPRRTVSIREVLPDGRQRRVTAVQTADLLYVPTGDLLITRRPAIVEPY